MKIHKHNAQPLSSEEIAHLEKLKSVAEKAIEDGKFSEYETEQIKSLLWADGKVTSDELRTLHQTIKSVMGDEAPQIEWKSHRRR